MVSWEINRKPRKKINKGFQMEKFNSNIINMYFLKNKTTRSINKILLIKKKYHPNKKTIILNKFSN